MYPTAAVELFDAEIDNMPVAKKKQKQRMPAIKPYRRGVSLS
jgi:hypothetical protein